MIPVYGKESVSFEIKKLRDEPRVAQTDTCSATRTAAGRRQRYIPGSSARRSVRTRGRTGVGRKETNGGNARIQTAGSLGCMAEANNIGKQLYSN